MPGATSSPCRLCGGPADLWARHLVLGKYDVAYFLCRLCGSVETEPPYWLEEAYNSAGTGSDTGVCQRNIDLVLRTSALLELMRWPGDALCVDYGAGMGLFARMMRDRGYQFIAYDKYQRPFYMDQFSVGDLSQFSPRLLTSHEVLEHLPDPARELKEIFGCGADLVLATTELCDHQKQDWWYLGVDQGQHVFFYSQRALSMIAKQFDYRYDAVANMHVFWKPYLNLNQAVAAAKDPRRFGSQMLEAFIRHQSEPYKFAARDSDAVARRHTH